MDSKYVLSFIFPQIVDVVESHTNGTITVELVGGNYRTVVNRYWQSGIYAKHIMEVGLRNNSTKPKQILILGFGCGSMVHVLHQRFPKAKITGVEIDPTMIEIGKKYFQLKEGKNLTMSIGDAYHFVMERGIRYDMIISDVFIGCDTPPKFLSPRYIKHLYTRLETSGVYICNCSYNNEHRKQTDMFLARIQRVFQNGAVIKSGPNLIIQAHKS